MHSVPAAKKDLQVLFSKGELTWAVNEYWTALNHDPLSRLQDELNLTHITLPWGLRLYRARTSMLRTRWHCHHPWVTSNSARWGSSGTWGGWRRIGEYNLNAQQSGEEAQDQSGSSVVGGLACELWVSIYREHTSKQCKQKGKRLKEQ
jgi:hypothetical protein